MQLCFLAPMAALSADEHRLGRATDRAAQHQTALLPPAPDAYRRYDAGPEVRHRNYDTAGRVVWGCQWSAWNLVCFVHLFFCI